MLDILGNYSLFVQEIVHFIVVQTDVNSNDWMMKKQWSIPASQLGLLSQLNTGIFAMSTKTGA